MFRKYYFADIVDKNGVLLGNCWVCVSLLSSPKYATKLLCKSMEERNNSCNLVNFRRVK